MDKLLKPSKLSIDPNSPSAAKEWRHWKRTFISFVNKFVRDGTDEDKLAALVNCATPDVYEYIDNCDTYEEAEATLEQLYVKRPNDIFARHLLSIEKQKTNQTLEDFRCTLVRLAKDCDFKDVTAVQYRDDMIRDSFINGLCSSEIRQRLLEHKTLTLKEAFQQAVTLDDARRDNRIFGQGSTMEPAIEAVNAIELESSEEQENSMVAAAKNVCSKCGSGKSHDFRNCRAKMQTCFKCGERGHYSRACHLQKKRFSAQKYRDKVEKSAAVNEISQHLCTTEGCIKHDLNHALVCVTIKGQIFKCLLDTGSSISYIKTAVARKFKIKRTSSGFHVGMAQASSTCQVTSLCTVDFQLLGNSYENRNLYLMDDLCVDVLLGRDFLELHKRIIFELEDFGGKRPELVISRKETCAVVKANISTSLLFSNLKPGWKPVATKSRRYNSEDKKFISDTVEKWKKAKTVRPSNSPWRAQCVVVKNGGIIERLAVDYSQTINLYTENDAFPIPLIEEIINDLASYRYFASYDLKRAYHQISIPEADKQFTAFEACGELLEFNVIPFGVTNGGPVFQRIMKGILDQDGLQNTLVYFDNVIVGGDSMDDLKFHSSRFLKSMSDRNMTLNESKTIYGVKELCILGYCVGEGQVRPDPERLKALMEIPPPSSPKSLQRVMGLFAYYSKWICRFSDKIKNLKVVQEFPLKPNEIRDFNNLKKDIADAALQAIDESVPFTVECDASDVAVSATLNQNGRPVAFMSRTLQGSEQLYPAVEKEATAIIESVRKWSHLLRRRPFFLITDQRSVAFMLDSRKRSKIKNNKIMCWRLELASFSYTIRYRPGNKNVGPDTLTRAYCGAISSDDSKLRVLHKDLCCPGVTRFWHYVRSKNLPYSLADVKNCCNECEVCAEVRPQFFSKNENTLIKSTQPMERLNIDFKGPLPSATKNIFFLCVVDEFSRFPFCFPCADVSAETVIGCLEKLFSLFGTCSYVHSDRGSAFTSKRFKDYLLMKGISSSRTTPYHPQGNSQVERYNGIVWSAIKCALKSRKYELENWEKVLPEALGAIRSLLCTATNETPHFRFFQFNRRTPNGRNLPEWLCKPGPVLLRKFVRKGKNDDLVRKVELVEANPMYARVRYPDGKESNVSLRDLARCPDDNDRGRVSPENVARKEWVSQQAPSPNSDDVVTDRPSNEEGPLKNGRNNLNLEHERSTLEEVEQGQESVDIPNVMSNHANEISGIENDLGELRRSQRGTRGVPPQRYSDYV